jgi:hypothetical protein
VLADFVAEDEEYEQRDLIKASTHRASQTNGIRKGGAYADV